MRFRLRRRRLAAASAAAAVAVAGVSLLGCGGSEAPRAAAARQVFEGPVRLLEPLPEGRLFLLANPPWRKKRDVRPVRDAFVAEAGDTGFRRLTRTGMATYVSAFRRRALVSGGGSIFRLDPRRLNRFRTGPLAIGPRGSVGPGGCVAFTANTHGGRRHAGFRTRFSGGPEVELLERHADGAICLRGRTVVAEYHGRRSRLVIFRGRRAVREVKLDKRVLHFFPAPGGGFAWVPFGAERVEIFSRTGRRLRVIPTGEWIAQTFDPSGSKILVTNPDLKQLGLLDVPTGKISPFAEISPDWETDALSWAHWKPR